MWSKMDKSESASTVVQGGEQEPTRFMEVDGVVR